jgi:hypothetical protein
MKIKYDIKFFFTVHLQVDVSILDTVPEMENFGIKYNKKGLLTADLNKTNSLNTDMKTTLASSPASEKYINT